MGNKANRLVWMDLEMTGLNPSHDRIIEIATIVTDNALEVIAEGPVIAIHQSNELLETMDEWCVKTHGSTGLTARVQASTYSEKDAETQTLEFLREHLPPKASPLCGNSICQDRRFLVNYMPELEAFFHYRNLDVSTLKELAKRWAPKIYHGVKKQNTHLALDDIRESIAELKHYHQHFIRIPNQ